MSRLSAARRYLAQGTLVALAALLTLSGCASSPTGQAQATATPTLIPIPPTPTPMALTTQTLDVGGFAASEVIPGPHGLLLFQFAKTPDNQPPGSSSGPTITTISFYNLATRKLTTVASPPDGLVHATYAGDWVSYATATSAGAPDEFWIYNVITGQRKQLAGATPWQFWVSNASDLVWMSFTGNGGSTSTLDDYSYATGATRTLATSSTAVIKPEAINAQSVLIFEDPINGAGSGTTWLAPLSGGAPVKISDEDGVGGSMNADYAVWGDPHASSTYMYDLHAGKLTPHLANCLRPSLDDTGPYMTCYDFSGLGPMLVRMPTGFPVILGAGVELSDGILFFNGRGYFVDPRNHVVYFDLPAQ